MKDRSSNPSDHELTLYHGPTDIILSMKLLKSVLLLIMQHRKIMNNFVKMFLVKYNMHAVIIINQFKVEKQSSNFTESKIQ